jgi:hypothetical protein
MNSGLPSTIRGIGPILLREKLCEWRSRCFRRAQLAARVHRLVVNPIQIFTCGCG